jgi:serine/threonine protein kinase
MVRVFVSYAHRDEPLFAELSLHLSALKREGLLSQWHDRGIVPGSDWRGEISRHLDEADVILLLVSADFLASDYCHDVELERALARADAGAARVVPIIVRPCDWCNTRVGGLQALPRDGLAITSAADRDQAWHDVALSIRALIRELAQGQSSRSAPTPLFANERVAELSRQLGSLYQSLEATLVVGDEPSAIYSEIAAVKRQLREGGRLEAGDYLGDGRYKLVELIGTGGFADVWKAYDQKQRGVVAVKVLHGVHARDQSKVDRFSRGARAMFALRHPGVLRVLDPQGREGNWHFFVMDYVRDGDLRSNVLAGSIGRERVVSLISAVARTLAYTHEKGMLHRDVCPSNILIDGRQPLLTDFDLVRVTDSTGGTRTGAMGKFCYASPELMMHPQNADERADVYALGMTAIFCYHGADLPMDVVYDKRAFVAKLACTDHIKRELERSTARKPEDRPGSVEEFAELLQLADSRKSARPDQQGKGKILVVDDRRNMRATLAMLLGGNGYDVSSAASAQEALDVASHEDYDVVLTDLRIGEMDGIDVLRSIKRRHPSTQIIMMTAYGTVESAVEAMKLGAFHYVSKPFSEQQLLDIVASALCS